MKGLHGYEIEGYFDKIPLVKNHFQGIFSIDKIPKTIKVKHFVIVNLSKASEVGTHWICMVRTDKTEFEIFNSLGFQNLEVILPHFKFRTKANFIFNKESYQLDSTSSCGLYCIYFAIERMLNLDLEFHMLLEDIFVADNAENEIKVNEFCHKLINSQSFLFD